MQVGTHESSPFKITDVEISGVTNTERNTARSSSEGRRVTTLGRPDVPGLGRGRALTSRGILQNTGSKTKDDERTVSGHLLHEHPDVKNNGKKVKQRGNQALLRPDR